MVRSRGARTVVTTFLSIVVALVLAGSAAAEVAHAKRPDLRSGCGAGSAPAHIGGKQVCLHAGLRCRARYERTYEKKGFKCVNGRLQKPPPPPPAPAPPPTAAPGLYQFTTNQCPGTLTCSNIGILTVLPGGVTFTNFFAPYAADCTPGYHWHAVLSTSKDVPLLIGQSPQPDLNLLFSLYGSFTMHIEGTPSIDGNASVSGFGQFTSGLSSGPAGNLSGQFDVRFSGNDTNGVHYECDTGTVKFIGKLQTG